MESSDRTLHTGWKLEVQREGLIAVQIPAVKKKE